jgi:hypothetical protein
VTEARAGRTRSPSAYAALRRGTAFVRAGIGRDARRGSVKVVGNMLAELDRLLYVLITETASDRGVVLPPRSRHTVVRLAALCAEHGRTGADAERLRALFWSTLCLRRHDGRAHRPDRGRGDRMTVGWPASGVDGNALALFPLLSPIMPSPDQLVDVCAFYDRLALHVVTPRPTAPRAYVGHGLELSRA